VLLLGGVLVLAPSILDPLGVEGRVEGRWSPIREGFEGADLLVKYHFY
jgi:hypothetical protein